MNAWAWMRPEERAEVLAFLENERRYCEVMIATVELVVAASKREPDEYTERQLTSLGPVNWHRVRAHWFAAAIEELGGGDPQDATGLSSEPSEQPPSSPERKGCDDV